jgi:hypothetical protein
MLKILASLLVGLALTGWSVSAQEEPECPYAGQTVRDPRHGRGLMQHREKNVPRVGGEAPDFTLRTPESESVTLSSFEGDQPVVLVFGSWT